MRIMLIIQYLKIIYNKSLIDHDIDFVQVASGARGSVGFMYSVAGIGSGSVCLMCLRLLR